MAQALVPLKDLVGAKTRLAGLLNPAERRSLAQAMVEDVLQVLVSHQMIARVTLVSDDPAAGLLARGYGVDHLEEASLGVRGLNPVIEAATDLLLSSATDPLIVLHADLPLLGAADLSAVIAAYRRRSALVIGSDRHRRGSNLLAFDRNSRPRFCFGKDSCVAHQAAAADAGIEYIEICRPGIAFDLDEATDVAVLMARLDDAGEHTRELLDGSDLGRRLALAVSALQVDNNQSGENSLAGK